MKKALIEALTKMTEMEATHLWAILSGVAEDDREHCAMLAEQGKLSAVEKQRLGAAEAIMHAGDVWLASLSEQIGVAAPTVISDRLNIER